ncbi:Bgt-51638 [Blumeria graminis f. sp. tritici]|uniref:Bgt-51638 n=1 Tax=Blumeria graminis f. sp. tritici TaxID=62690 RepID=A0A9X9MPB8_BLUGR|nr:Bgt-51638 [Blumeria graminis f. sp. tritici]
MYLPDGTNGFVCGTEFLSIDNARKQTNAVIEAFFFDERFQTFPMLFEESHLFNVKSEILLSWPARSSGKVYTKDPGKSSLIINIRGQIMGMVIIKTQYHNHHLSFEKCSPVRSSNAEGNIESRHLDKFWSIAFPRFGFRCGSRYFPLSMVKSGNDLDSNYYFQTVLDAKYRSDEFVEYSGDQFIGSDLRIYPLHHSSTSKQIFGPHGRYRAVFDMTNREFKGIIDVKDREEKCVTVWDLSSASPDTVYKPTSILHTERMPDKYWPATCVGTRFKYKTIWLFIEFALKKWPANGNHKKFNFPILNENGSQFWPVRIPETQTRSSTHAFAIGYDTVLNTYGMYEAVVRNGILSKYELCLDLPIDDIRSLEKKLSQVL